MAALIAEVTGEPVGRIVERLESERKHPGSTVVEDFARGGGRRYEWGPHLERFYGSTNAFLYELAVWNRNLLKQKLRHWVSRHIRRQSQRLGRPLDVLSVGDGLGFDCLEFARHKQRVTYMELPGPSEQFARKLFEGTGSDIPVVTDPAAIPHEAFDAITSFDVLEHVPDPPAIVRNFASWLRPGGLLYVSAPFFMLLPWYPTHLRICRRYSGSLRLYRRAGFRLVGGTPSWYPIVFQKPGPEMAEPSPVCWVIRLTGAIQRIGRITAWPFAIFHLVRRAYNRPLPSD